MAFCTGHLLFSDCGGSRQFVVGYVAGWLDKWRRDEYLARRNLADAVPAPKAMVNSAHFGNSVCLNICIPTSTTAADVSVLLCELLRQNPGIREAAGDDLMMTLVRGKFSCFVRQIATPTCYGIGSVCRTTRTILALASIFLSGTLFLVSNTLPADGGYGFFRQRSYPRQPPLKVSVRFND
jgi:hypothetical protein